MKRRTLLATATLGTLATPALAQWAPSRTVTILIPFAAGGATDVMGRLIAQPMAAKLGQTVVVENMAGASGGVAAARVARSPADGHLLFLGHIGVFAFNAHLFQRLAYDPADFIPTGLVATNPMVLLVSRNSGITNIEQLRERGRAGRLSIGSSGLGTTLHMGGVMVNRALGGGNTLVPYRGGGPAINDLHAGVLDVVIDQALTALPAVEAGARPLAVTGPVRLPQIPDTPTTREAGLPGLDLEVWNILTAVRGTPAPILAAVTEALGAALDDGGVRARFAAASARIPAVAERGPAFAANLVRTENVRWGQFIREAGIERE
ncbi:MAG: tripartite tricarboxylate transporter substrate binding protein [Rubritepida sp.]|nr:tripartite tricarboxylate transporter substrate binding protein [Rubritepida sp.]